ncbi:hypothetical protein [Maricaulis maris]|uniref:hypothetical protein n=1 Tax=Maricaulis maris TaxID=74318 RepID=UPI003B8D71A4
MDTLPQEAQLAVTSFIAAMLIGGPVALVGAGNAFAIARWTGAFMLRRRLASSALLGLVGGAGVFGSGLFGNPALDIAALIGQAFA